MMETHEKFKAEINRKLSEVNAKIMDLKKHAGENAEIKKDLSVILKHLELIRNNIILEYEKIDQMKKENVEYPELQKNIYSNFNSFEEAFTKAGSIFKSEKFRSRERSVDFNNPTGNK